MTVPSSRKGVVKRYRAAPENIRDFFFDLDKLVEHYPLEISISYLFGLVELAQNNTLYCGVVKLHRVDAELANKAIDAHELYKDDFRQFYEAIFGKKIKKSTFEKLDEAQKVRNRIVHGKSVEDKDKRKAIADVLEFAEKFNADVDEIAGFMPFGDLRGFKGRGKPLDKSTSRWVLKGIGLL